MRLAVFIKSTTFHKGYGGMETLNKTLCEGLVQRGYEITVFSPQKEQTILTTKENGVNYVFVPSVFRTLYPKFLKNNWYSKSVEVFKQHHAKTPFDLVLSQSSAGLGIITHKAHLKIKVVSIAHGSILSEISTRYHNIYSLKSFLRLLPDTLFALYNFFSRQRVYIHGSDLVVTVSEYVKKALIEETYAPGTKFEVIHNGVSKDKFLGLAHENVSGQKPTTVKLLFLSQLIKEKGAMLLPELISGAAFDNVTVEVIGGGPVERELKAKIAKFGLEKKLLVHGKLPYTDALKYYSKSDIFLFPTKRIEGFPMVLVEAMLAGLPIVGFDLGGVSDAITDSTGFLVPAGKIAAFREKLELLVADADLRKKLGENAKIKAETYFTAEVMLDTYEKVIKRFIV